jgi:hypothetical protein
MGGELLSDGNHIDTFSEFGGLENIKKYLREQSKDINQLRLSVFKAYPASLGG